MGVWGDVGGKNSYSWEVSRSVSMRRYLRTRLDCSEEMGLPEGDVLRGRKMDGRLAVRVQDADGRKRKFWARVRGGVGVWAGLWLARNGGLIAEGDSRPRALRMLRIFFYFFFKKRLPERFLSAVIWRKS